MAEFFGFEINRKRKEPVRPSFVPRTDDDGAGVIQAGGHFGAYIDMDGDKAKTDVDLIMKYRDISSQPECDAAIEDIINEAIVGDHDNVPVNILLDELEISDKIKETIKHEFGEITRLLNFNQYAHDIFRKWYVDGRLPYHIIINNENPKAGIKELRYIDPAKLRKIKEIEEETDPKTGAKLIKKVDEYFMYQDKTMNAANQGLKIYPDAIAYCTSGQMDPGRRRILSYLHKALKPVNQLRMMEDSLVIYRISRAPERRIFYIDVGNLPKVKAEQYIRDIMTRYKNRLVYDSESGEVRDDRRHQSMLEDYWLPRREGGRGTEISTLPGGENLGQLDDVEYFQRKLYKAMHVPVSRLEADSGFSLGRESEITRDELLFSKFVHKLQIRFSSIFQEIMEKQLILKNIMTSAEWNAVKDKIQYDFTSDHFYTELKQQEILNARMTLARDSEDFVGKYYSKEWFRTNILRQTEEEAQLEDERIESENESEMEDAPSDDEDI